MTPSMKRWIEGFLCPDGSFRDIRLHPRRSPGLFRWIRDHYTTRYLENHVEKPWPGAKVADARPGALLVVTLTDNVRLHAHYFDQAWLKLDADPREIKTAADIDALLDFMARLGKFAAEDVDLLLEGHSDRGAGDPQDGPWLRYDHLSGQFRIFEVTERRPEDFQRD